MQSSGTANLQEDVNNECPKVLTACLETPEIVRNILQHLHTIELLQNLSYVNKLWNHEARSILRNRGHVLAKMSFYRPCQDLKAFASDVKSMNVVPYAGLVVMPMTPCNVAEGCIASPTGGLDPSFDVILDRLRWKNLFIILHHYEGSNKNCPAFLLMTKILQDFGGGIENMSVAVDLNRPDYFEQVLQNCNFFRLRVLVVIDGYATMSQDSTSLIKRLISRAPNLRELYFRARVDFTENLVEGSSAALLPQYEMSPTVDEIHESVVKALRLEWLKLFQIRQDLSPQRANLTISTILQASRTTLTSLQIDAFFMAPLMCYGIPLVNVVDLMIYFNGFQPFGPHIARLIGDFDFTRIFPSLTKLDTFVLRYPNTILKDQILEMIDDSYPASNERVPDRAVNITALRLQYAADFQDVNNIRLMSFLFPRIETLCVCKFRGDVIPRFLWSQPWANLKALEIVKFGQNPSRNQNLDSVFCGIFPEEVAELREKDDEYLKAVNIVPVMPSFVCFKGLRSFTFTGDSACLSRRGANASETDNVPAEMFSKVTGLMAFKRCPGVSVTLKTDDAETKRELDHMEPYANVLLGPVILGNR